MSCTDWAWQAVTSRQGHTEPGTHCSESQLPTSWQLAPLCVCCPPRTLSDPLLTESWCSAESGVTVATHHWSRAQSSARSSLFALWLWSVVPVSSCPRFLFSRPPVTRHGRGQTTPAPALVTAPGPWSSWPAHLSPVASHQVRAGPESPTRASLAHNPQSTTQYPRFFSRKLELNCKILAQYKFHNELAMS